MKAPRAWVLVLLAAAACQGPRPPRPVPPAPVPDANLVVTVNDVVERPDEEGVSYAKVYVDGVLAGQTPTGPKSQDKSWSGRLDPGNRLVRVEYWLLPGLGDWERLADDYQPRERFIRVEPGLKTILRVRFFDRSRKSSLEVSREPG